MVKIYSSEVAKLKMLGLSDADLANIGRLVRGFAEIEDLLTLYIARVAETSPLRATILMGQASISTKVRIADDLAKSLRNEEALVALKTFREGDGFKGSLDRRNAVAHGVYQGTSEDGRHYFLTNRSTFVVEAPVAKGFEQLGISPNGLKESADWCDKAYIWMLEHLGVKPLLEKRREGPALPHPKARRPKGKTKE